MKRLVIILTMMCLGVNYAIGEQLLHRGWYTHYWTVLDQVTDITDVEITFYDDRIEERNETDLKKGSCSTTPFAGIQNGLRVYRKVQDLGFMVSETLFYIDADFNVVNFSSGGRIDRIVKKGQNPGSFGGGNIGGLEGSNPGGNNPGKQPQPQTKPQYTKTCGVCHGTGRCIICAGDGWVIRMGMGKDGPCPSCPNRSGKCSACGGRGTWKE